MKKLSCLLDRGRLIQSIVGEGFYYRRDQGYYHIKVTGVLVRKF